MTKNIIIVLMAVTCLVLTVYGMIQKTEAKRQSILAEQNAIAALQATKEATACAAEVQRMKSIAEEQALLSNEILKKEKNKSK